ncbi:MAG: DUF2461 domain-containing protein [Clostridia bacterium]|nr:DUF2461 domain-containing protein [Clostridia bacterium]
MGSFTGFTDAAFEFFMALAFDNTAQTMERLRPQFNEHVLAPLKALSSDCTQTLFVIDPEIDFRPVMGGTISRIRRDTRYSRDKTPYRDYMWLDFRRKRESCHLGFHFSISPRGASVSMGLHDATSDVRDAVRAYTVAHGARYRALHELLAAQGYAFLGETYKRAMTKAQDPVVFAFGQKRWFTYRKPIPMEAVRHPELSEQLAREFTALAPLYQFIRTATGGI